MSVCDTRARRGFTLVELLVVVGILATLIAILLPALGRARQVSSRTQCLSNIRQLQLAQEIYAANRGNLLVAAGDGTAEQQGAWIAQLQQYCSAPLVRRCPSDSSPFFDQPVAASDPPRYRTTSYGINNYVSPTHAPFGGLQPKKINQVPHASKVIHFVELAEVGTYATADHIHVQSFYLPLAPQISIGLIAQQMPLGRHGGGVKSWDAVLNFTFLDGHAESLSIRQVYTNPKTNLFDPAVAR